MRKPTIILAALALGVTPLLAVSPAQAASYTVTATASKSQTTTYDGVGFTFSGSIKPGTANKTVNIQKYKSGSWVTIFTTTTNSSGKWSYNIQPTTTGVIKLRASTAKSGSIGAGASKSVSVTSYSWLELAELAPVSDNSSRYYDGGTFTFTVDGVQAGDDAWVNDDPDGGFGVGKTTWDFKESCIRLRGFAGIDDDLSETGAIGKLRIKSEGSSDYLREFDKGEIDNVYRDIKKTRYLTIASNRVNPDESTVVGLGEPEVLCSKLLATDS